MSWAYMLNTAHLAGSIVNSALAIAAAVMIYRSMQEGLTQEHSHAGIVMLAAFAAGRSLHAVGESFGLSATEVFEYVVYLAGYVYFMMHLTKRRAGNAGSPPGGAPR